nr:hypothetical protein [Tanacetum cinerariifolium]
LYGLGNSSVCKEGFGALETTSTSNLQMAFIWVVKGGKKGFGLLGLSRVTGSYLGVISGNEGLCDDDFSIVDSYGFGDMIWFEVCVYVFDEIVKSELLNGLL